MQSRFLFDDHRIRGHETGKQLGLQDGDSIDAMVERQSLVLRGSVRFDFLGKKSSEPEPKPVFKFEAPVKTGNRTARTGSPRFDLPPRTDSDRFRLVQLWWAIKFYSEGDLQWQDNDWGVWKGEPRGGKGCGWCWEQISVNRKGK